MKNLVALALVLGAISRPAISRVVIFMSFRFLELVVAHSAFANVFERGNESLTGIWPRKFPVSVGDFSPKICKMAYYGKTTLGLNSIVGICFIKSTITIFIFSGHKCF